MEIQLQGAIAKSLKARRLILMTNIEGVLDKEKKINRRSYII